MSLKQGLMALLAEGPMCGAQLRVEFEERTGGTWPLNAGQVYATLRRLERDGLVQPTGENDSEGRIPYCLSDAGRTEVSTWRGTPVDHETTPRNELLIKLALAVTVPGVNVHAVVNSQRTSTLKHSQSLSWLKQQVMRNECEAESHSPAEGVANHDLAWLLVLENLIFTAEAELRWLDLVEARLHRESVAPLLPHRDIRRGHGNSGRRGEGIQVAGSRST